METIIIAIAIVMLAFVMVWMLCALVYIGCEMDKENPESMTTFGKIVYHIARLY